MNFLEAEMNVIQLILTDLQKYKAAASEAAAKLGFSIPSLDSTGGDAVVFLKPESHLVRPIFFRSVVECLLHPYNLCR